MTAREVMIPHPVSVKPETPLHEVARLLVGRGGGVVLVLSDEGDLLGIVTESDLFLKEKGVPFSLVKLPSLFNEWVKLDRLHELYARTHRHTAADVMTRNLVTVTPDTDIGEIAALMLRHRIKRVPVVEGNKLLGIVTRHELIRKLACKP
ncbi:MAG: CBS domain-containing protein [Bryobacterales bacterium]|nr:CBS domain-containing protein [Bryobacteraceae bacterium]MDW8356061.1 CBS domain-containing protein [Bryobacterales bacterium]